MKKIYSIYLVLLALIPFIPPFDRIDIIGPQFFYLSVINLFFLIGIKIKNELLILNDKKIIFFCFLFLSVIFFSLLSTFNAYNYQESLIEIARLITFFTTIYFVFLSIYNLKNITNVLLLGLLIFLSIEVLYILKIFVNLYEFNNPPARARDFQGFAYNQNVAAFSIVIKLPILIYFILKKNSKVILALLFILNFLLTFIVLVISSRGAIIAMYLVFILTFVGSVYIKSFNKRFSIRILFLITGLISSFFLQKYLYQNQINFTSSERIQTLASSTDSSIDYRINMYKAAIDGFKENPLFGVGIGNYKINSIKFLNDYIEGYIVPYNTHNDFLQMFSETGLFGGISYLIFIASPLFFLFFQINKKNRTPRMLEVLFIISLIVFIFDSSINFPRARLYSLINLIFIFGLIFGIYKAKQLKVIHNFNKIFPLVFLMLLFSVVILYFVNRSYRDQAPVYIDYNQNQLSLVLDTEKVNKMQNYLPNISTTTIPINYLKSMYLIRDNRYEEAIDLIHKSKNTNPYLGIGENLLCRIYLNQNKLDSAAYYGKLSINKLPKNNTHITFYQMVLERQNDIEESRRIFLESKRMEIDDPVIWSNYILTFTIGKLKTKLDYTDEEKNILLEALDKYPNNESLLLAEKVVFKGIDDITTANDFDLIAQKKFEDKDYEKAISNWEKAIEIIPNEDSYYLNIIQSNIMDGNIEEAKKWINEIKAIGLVEEGKGKLEFLEANVLIQENKILKSCELLKTSSSKGYSKANELIKLLKCF